MLGKCIKNEIINRYAQVVSLGLGILIFSGVVALLNEVKASVSNEYFTIFVGLVDVLFTITMIGVMATLVLLPCTDFMNRFFKDQGYLTHTLPVKTSTLIVARMICDILMVTVLAAIYPLCICIATRNFDFFGMIIDMLVQFLKLGGSTVERSLLVFDGILIIVGIWLSVLGSLWTINMAYSFGHAFTKNKRLMSIMGIVVLVVIYFILAIMLEKVMSSPSIINMFENMLDSMDNMAGSVMIVFLAMDILGFFGVAALAIGTSWICKHKLNLE